VPWTSGYLLVLKEIALLSRTQYNLKASLGSPDIDIEFAVFCSVTRSVARATLRVARLKTHSHFRVSARIFEEKPGRKRSSLR
jgi:hypothetical protein